MGKIRGRLVKVAVAGGYLPAAALSLAELKQLETALLPEIPHYLAKFCDFGVRFGVEKRLKRLPMHHLMALYRRLVRAQYGALLACPGSVCDRLMLGKAPDRPFVEVADAAAAGKLQKKERSRIEYGIALLTASLRAVFGGHGSVQDCLFPTGDFGDAPQSAPEPEEVLKKLGAMLGAKVIDRRPDAIGKE